jgi:hypothetical protein
MRAAGETFLPRFAKESKEVYSARLRSSWLFNGYRKTIKDMTGRVFSKPVELAEDAGRLTDWMTNVDMQGRDLSTFARQVFDDGLHGAGISYIMVDAPTREGVVTQAQAAAQNLRPYMVSLRVEDILGWRAETVNNVTALTQLRIMETITEEDPADEFADKEIKQVRVLDLMPSGVQTRLYRKAKVGLTWELVAEPTVNAAVRGITVVPFYANRTGFFTGAPMLDDLADINIAHWQSQSDQRNILHYARVPILFGAGVEANSIGTIGASTAVVAADPNAKLQWVEHSGQAIAAGRNDLKDLEFQMEAFGLQLLVAQPAAQSATGEALDAAKETSTLAMTADELKDALELALGWMATLGGLDASPSAVVNKDFGAMAMTAQDVSALLQAYRDGLLSRATVLEEFARRGFVRSDLDADEEAKRIDDDEFESPADAMAARGNVDTSTQQGIAP